MADTINSRAVLRHLPDASLREHLLLNSQSNDKNSLMAAEIRSVAMARTTWSGPVPMDLSVLAQDTVCNVCSKKGHFARDCWYKPARVVEKEKKGQMDKKRQGKGTTSRDGDNKKKGPCHNCDEFGHFVRDCPKKKESNNSNSSGGRDLHCTTCTDDQSQWIMMLADIYHDYESSGDVEYLVDSGVGCHVWRCKVKPGSSQAGTFLTATKTPIESQRTQGLRFRLFEVHSDKITVTAAF